MQIKAQYQEKLDKAIKAQSLAEKKAKDNEERIIFETKERVAAEKTVNEQAKNIESLVKNIHAETTARTIAEK